jgi:hypothetical protein
VEATIPADEDVVSVTATLHNYVSSGMQVPHVAEFLLPRKYVGTVLAAFRPAAQRDEPVQGEKAGRAIGVLKVTTTQGRVLSILWYESEGCDEGVLKGNCRVCYLVNGFRCARGGSYNPVWSDPAWIDNQDEYADEAFLLTVLIQLIDEEQRTGKAPDKLGDTIETLERSRGDRPPKE